MHKTWMCILSCIFPISTLFPANISGLFEFTASRIHVNLFSLHLWQTGVCIAADVRDRCGTANTNLFLPSASVPRRMCRWRDFFPNYIRIENLERIFPYTSRIRERNSAVDSTLHFLFPHINCETHIERAIFLRRGHNLLAAPFTTDVFNWHSSEAARSIFAIYAGCSLKKCWAPDLSN